MKLVPWAKLIAKLREHPDTWVVFPEMTQTKYRTIRTIRRRQIRALRLDDGVIRCQKRAIAWLENGDVIVTLALKFDPKKEDNQ